MPEPTKTSRRPDLNRDLATLFGEGSVLGATDGELLDRFLTSRDQVAERAFEALVWRHGPMVWGVCRRILADPTDAEDAFQATFLVLVRKARSVRVDDSLGRWLYGVSRKVATRTRADRDRRRGRERGGIAPDRPDPASRDPAWAETCATLDAEVARLPEPFRSAVVLCDLGGLTHEQAALDLGCPVGTIKSRLARGRDRLRLRMVQRGVDWGTGSVLVGLSAPPETLVGPTVRAGLALAVSGVGRIGLPLTWSGWFFASKGVYAMMITFPAPILAGLTLAAALGATGFSWVAGGGDDTPPASTRPPVVAPAPASTREALPEYVVDSPDILIVEVLEALPGRPISGEQLVRPDGKISLGYYGELFVRGLTVAQIKEKLVLHLRAYLTDAVLGLSTITDGVSVTVIDPGKTTKVFVGVAHFNSHAYYVQGDVAQPGRLSIHGNETVLDAIMLAGGVSPGIAQPIIRLVRPAPGDQSAEQSLPVDLAAIIERAETATNHRIHGGDRVVVARQPAQPELADRGTPESLRPSNNPAAPAPTNPGAGAAVLAPLPPREFHKVTQPDYVVEPPDLIVVEVLEALPGQPITGERLVRPDGRISLGYYGEVYVAGLTTTEIKAKVILHLRNFLSEATLGLSATRDGKSFNVPAALSSRVFVDLAAYNSKVYYVQGQVETPSRLPVTGNETVLDALSYAGGVVGLNLAQTRIRLVRPASRDHLVQQLQVDLAAIVERGDAATNYQIMPGDRLIVSADPEATPARPVAGSPTATDQDARLREVERKLDLILQKLEDKGKP